MLLGVLGILAFAPGLAADIPLLRDASGQHGSDLSEGFFQFLDAF
jgi:hypothetical protein